MLRVNEIHDRKFGAAYALSYGGVHRGPSGCEVSHRGPGGGLQLYRSGAEGAAPSARLSKGQRGIVHRFLSKVTGLGRSQLTRLVSRWRRTRRVTGPHSCRPCFPSRYTPEDAALLAAVDAAHEDLSGPAVRHIFEREFKVHGKAEYQRLAGIAVPTCTICGVRWATKATGLPCIIPQARRVSSDGIVPNRFRCLRLCAVPGNRRRKTACPCGSDRQARAELILLKRRALWREQLADTNSPGSRLWT
jgi:hypothetical protein